MRPSKEKSTLLKHILKLSKMEKLTIEIAKEKVAHIESIKDDDERAHSCEDDLMLWFINCISYGQYSDLNEVQEIAKIVYSTTDIQFARWCA